MKTFERKLGCESLLVQAKLGHDLRPLFDDTFRAEMPERIKTLADRLMGYTEFRELSEHGHPRHK